MAYFVVGDSTIRVERINDADLVSAAGSRQGFTEVARVGRDSPVFRIFEPELKCQTDTNLNRF